ncbi:hypothetical protein [Streptomyces axinellae]|uniref:Uncharacterized protein n=1 Tax=Streptomyces axinellae TaxID=552788 RepID=A0ABN3PMG2_9ACTN
MLYRGTWYEVLRVNPKSPTIPPIHNGVGQKIVRAADNRLDGWTWAAPYDECPGAGAPTSCSPRPSAEAA